MRYLKLALLPAAALLACSTFAHADMFPDGGYVFDAHPGTGPHLSYGTLTGTIDFDAAHDVTAADIVYTNTSNVSFTFTDPGATSYDTNFPATLSATIYDASDPTDYYFFSINIPGNLDGSFKLNCGVDCHTFVSIGPNGDGDYEEFDGTIVPAAATPEPSSLVLAASGMLALAGALRRRVINA